MPFCSAICNIVPADYCQVFGVFCESDLYQAWRYTSCSVTLRLPEGGQHRMAENDIFVLRYYPGRRPCWDVVTDLGGYSLFIGKNNAVSMLADCVPGLRGNFVYWIGGRCRDKGMVFGMETGSTTPCKSPPLATEHGHPQSTIWWYFLKH